MKLLFFCISMLLSVECFSQQSNAQYFVQGMVYSENPERIDDLVLELKSNPNVFVVRFDNTTNGLLVVTKSIDFTLTTETFQSWLTDNTDLVSCIRIGLQNVDSHMPFPLTNCENE